MVAGLFGGDGPELLLEVILAEQPEPDDITIFLRFQAIVARTAGQELFHRWDESDPLSARLWRTVHRVLRHDPRFVLFPGDRPEWAALAGVDKLCAENPLIDFDGLAHIVADAYSPRKSIASLLADILTILADSGRYRLCLSVDMLYAALRQAVAAAAGADAFGEEYQSVPDPVLAIALDKALHQAASEVDKILNRYDRTGKLPAELIEPFRKALADIVGDLAAGFPAMSYLRYLRLYLPQLTPKEYRNRYRTRFEYLAEIAQDSFIEQMWVALTENSRQSRPRAPISVPGTKKGNQ